MYIIYNKLSDSYFSNTGWVELEQNAVRMTKLRAEELLESFLLKKEKGWESGDYVIISVDI